MSATTHKHPPTLAVLLLAVAIYLPMGGAAQHVTISHYPLQMGLDAIEQQYGCAFLYEPNVIRGQRFDPAWLTQFSNLGALLKHVSKTSSLLFTEIEAGFWTIQSSHPYGRLQGFVFDDEGQPLIGASLYHPDSERGASTDINGYYNFWVPAGDVTLQVSYIGFRTVDTSFWLPFGQLATTNYTLKSSVDLVEVTVIGDTPRSLSYLATPAVGEQFTTDDKTTAPIADLGQMLQYAVPSFHSTYQTVSDGTDHIDPPTLRGLAPDQLLVLVNGHRRHSSALINVNNTIGRGSVATDLNSIPASAIARVEILPDGTTARYGSDAIAGVINLVLKDSLATSSVRLTTGVTAQGDGLQAGLTGHWQVYANPRGLLNLSWRLDVRESVNRSGNYQGLVFGDARDANADSLAQFFAQTGFSGQRVMMVGSAAIGNAGFWVNHEKKLGRSLLLYQFGGINRRQGQSHGFYRFPYQQRRQSGLYPWGFSPQIHPGITDASWQAGVRTTWNKWQVDASHGIGTNQLTFQIKNSNNASMGLQSPTAVQAGGLRYGQMNSQLDVSRTGQDRKTALFLGFGWRYEWYAQHAGEAASWANYGDTTALGEAREAGIQVFPGYRPTNAVRAARSTAASYLQWDQVLGRHWQYSVAFRGEYQPDAGEYLTGKLAVQYQTARQQKFRMAVNTGLRPPSLAQQYFSSNISQFVPGDNGLVGIEIAQLNSQHLLVGQLLRKPLQAERSFNYSLRYQQPLAPSSTLTLTAYHISIHNRIVLGSRLGRDDDEELAALLSTQGLTEIQFFTNAIRTRTWGLDAGWGHAWSLPGSQLSFRMAASYNRTRVQDVRLPAALQGLEDRVFNREDRAFLEQGQPASKWIGQLTWHKGPWELGWQSTRFGRVSYLHPADGDAANWVVNTRTGRVESRDQTFRAKYIHDVSVHWQPTSALQLSIHAKNIFDTYPDAHSHSANTSNGIFTYSRHIQQFGVWGAMGIVGLEVGF